MKTKGYMKRLSIFISIVFMCACLPHTIYAQNDLPKVGDTINNFEVINARANEDEKFKSIILKHKKTEALVVYKVNEDTNRSFDISFKTPTESNNGTAHILEHSVLSGSEKYPSSTLFFKLISQTYNTYMNAYTYQNYTTYPVASMSEKQLYKLADFYLDSVFNPLIYTDKSIFEREAWHYELDNENDALTVSGTVYSEMQGKQNISYSHYYNTWSTLFPDSYYANRSGGNPSDILKATYSEVIEYHKKYYHPSNSLTVIYGDIDYKEFLKLLDGYFSEYEKKDFDIDFSAFTETSDKHTEQTFEYPAANGDETKPYITYAFECKGANSDDISNLTELAVMMNNSSSEIQKQVKQQLPNITVSCSVDTDSPEPMVSFIAIDINEEDKYKFKEIIDKAIADIINNGISDTLKESSDAEERRSKSEELLSGAMGVAFSVGIAEEWALSDDIIEEFTQKTDTSDAGVEDTVKQYLNSSSRTALVTTVPSVSLKNEQQSSFQEEMSKLKASMTKEEISGVISNIQEYRKMAETSYSDADKAFINEINVMKSSDFIDETKDYNIQDTQHNDVRYVTSTVDVEDIGKGRIMIDVSHISDDNLQWFALYNILAGAVDTEKYTQSQLSELMAKYTNGGTDYVILKTKDGMKPYFIFKYEGFSDESEETFDIANQVLFKSDFSNTDMIYNIVKQRIDNLRYEMENEAYNVLLIRAMAAKNDEYAYRNAISGEELYDFFNSVLNTMNTDPSKVVEKLTQIQDMVYNRNGAMVVYAGNDESIKRNTEMSQKFFSDIPNKEIEPADFSYLRTESQSEAFVINSDVNYTGVYATLNDLGIEYDGSLDVVWKYVYDKFLIPELRNKYNVYGILGNFHEYGFSMHTYMDPGFDNTMYTYMMLPEMIRQTEITQEELDGYILSAYSDFTTPSGAVHSAYWAAADYTNGVAPEVRAEKMSQIRNTTVDDVKNFADLLEKTFKNGVLFTAANATVVGNYKDIFDNIYNPFNYTINNEIAIIVNNEKIQTAIPAQIVNDITLVPMRDIFEKIGAEVTWDQDTMTATAKKDDKTVSFKINSNIIFVSDLNGNQNEIKTEAAAGIVDDYTMIPLRAVSEALNCNVDWNPNTYTVDIEY